MTRLELQDTLLHLRHESAEAMISQVRILRPLCTCKGGLMSDVVYRSNVRIERVKGPVRRAFLPSESQPVVFGVHGAVAEHYKVPPNVLDPHATTLDYVVAATAG